MVTRFANPLFQAGFFISKIFKPATYPPHVFQKGQNSWENKKKEFLVGVNDVDQAKKMLGNIQSLEDFYDINLSSIKSLSGISVGFGSSDSRLDLTSLYSTKSREQFLRSANDAINALNDLYPAERAYRLEFSPSSVISVYLDRVSFVTTHIASSGDQKVIWDNGEFCFTGFVKP